MTETDPSGAAVETTTTVFFSYSRDDQKRAVPIIKQIENAGYRVWWDGMLEAGTSYLETTEQALETAKAVVVLWSPTSIKSHWVRDESMHGREFERLVPLSIGNARPPLGFRQIQVIDMEKWSGRAASAEIDDLIRSIALLHGDGAAPATISTSPAWRYQIPRRNLLIGGAALTVLGASIIGGAKSGVFSGRRRSNNGIVVLPFLNLTGDPQYNYVSNGVSADVRSELARNDALRVVAQTSSEAVQREQLDASAISRRLGVAFLLEGYLRLSGDVLDLSVQLTEGRSEFTQWSQSFLRSPNDLISAQSDISNAVVRELAIDASPSPAPRKIGQPTNPDAYKSYLQGLDAFKSNRSDAALALMDTAIRQDPAFAAAHAARARILSQQASVAVKLDDAARLKSLALSAAQRAIETGPELADAHSTLAWIYITLFTDFKNAELPFERALQFGRGNAPVLSRYAVFKASIGNDKDAQTAMKLAQQLDPENPTVHRAAGYVQSCAGRYTDAIAAHQRALELSSKLSNSHARIGIALLQLERPTAALAACEKEPAQIFRNTCLAITHWKLGQKDQADAQLRDLVETFGDASLYQQAQIFAGWNQPEKALEALQRAVLAGDTGLIETKTDPLLKPLRDNLEFLGLLTTLGLA